MSADLTMTINQPSGSELAQVVSGFGQPASLWALAAVLGCVGLAYLAARWWPGRAQAPEHGFWFGARVVDGVLFPLVVVVLLVALYQLVKHQGLREISLPMLRVALTLAASLLGIRAAVRVLRSAYAHSRAVRIFERSLSWVVWGAVVLWLSGIGPALLQELESFSFKLAGTPVTLRALLEGAFSAAAVLVLALWVSAAIESRLLASAQPMQGGELSLRKMAAFITRALLLLVGLLLALSAAGIPLGALGVMGGAVGVGIGLGLQRLAANYVSGFVMLAERSLRIGDMVRVDNFEGRITDISARFTVIRALNGRESIVPNEMMVTQRVENSSLADPMVALNCAIQVPYEADVSQVMTRFSQAVAAVPRVLTQPAPQVMLNGFAADGLDMNIAFWVRDPENGQNNVRSEVNLALLAAMTELGLSVPYPQRVMRQV
jgi:small-conductance mechanosensitive channel